jgi:hypothetical protein
MQNEQQSTFNSLRDQGPGAWSAYLLQFEEGQPIAGLSMEVIYSHALGLAKVQVSLDWAAVAIRAAEQKALDENPIIREDSRLKAMRVRSWFISRKGARAGDFVLDKDIILRWAMEGVSLSPRMAMEKAAKVRDLLARGGVESSSSAANDLRQLRRMRHRLNVVKELADCGELANDHALGEWLEVREQLP